MLNTLQQRPVKTLTTTVVAEPAERPSVLGFCVNPGFPIEVHDDRVSLIPPGYRWSTKERLQLATRYYDSTLLAHRLLLDAQRANYAKLFVELLNRDVVEGHIVPAIRQHLGFRKIWARNLGSDVSGAETTWRDRDTVWQCVPAETYSGLIPLEAMETIKRVQELGFPFQKYFVVWDTFQPRERWRFTLVPGSDPYLCGQLGTWIVAIAYWR